jgi:hypothetical protein
MSKRAKAMEASNYCHQWQWNPNALDPHPLVTNNTISILTSTNMDTVTSLLKVIGLQIKITMKRQIAAANSQYIPYASNASNYIQQNLFLWLMPWNLHTGHPKQHIIWKKWITNWLQSLKRH